MSRGLMAKESAVRPAVSGLLVALLAAGFPGMGLAAVAETPADGALFVVSEPEGATVYFDGEVQGVTPIELAQLSPGDHRVTLAKEGYLENSRVLTVAGGQTRTLDVDLTPSSGETRHTIQIRTEERGGAGASNRKWLYIAGAGGAAAAAIILLSGGNEPPVAGTVGVSPTDVGIASVTSFTFTSQGASDADDDPLTYSWDFGDGGTGSGQSTSHVYGSAGSYTVTVTVSDGKDSATATGSVTVRDVSGTWRGTIAGTYPCTLNLTQDGTSVSGSYSDPDGPGTIRGSVTAPRSMRLEINQPPYAFTFTGTLNSNVDQFTGTTFGGNRFTVTRQ